MAGDMVRPWLILIALTLSVAAAAHAAPASRTEVAIREVRLSNGARRYAVPISIGRTAMLDSLDTGSTGLRILPGALGPADATASAKPESYGYASGSRYEGVVGEAALVMGDVRGTAPVHLIRSIGCYAYLPRCPASRTTLPQYGI
ncbi:MAG: hypothetical protein JWP23_2169, partial [Phenylobacterium sp.]|nr:hypothetical protein [Phenylobacterium sp.]